MDSQTKFIRVNLRINPADLRSAQEKGIRVINIGGRHVATHFVTKAVRRSMLQVVRALKLNCEVHENPDKDHPWLYKIVYVYKPCALPSRMQGALKITRPDGDNLTKGVLDAITESHIAWADDSQAHCAGEYRRYALKDEIAHIQLTLRRIDNNSVNYSEEFNDDDE